MIIEDELPAQEILRSFIREREGWSVTSVHSDPIQAMQSLKDEPVDLIFLDIQLPRISGMELLRMTNSLPLIVISSAFAEHAIEAFELEVFDYLLKPYSKERFIKTAERVEATLSTHAEQARNLVLVVDRKVTRIPVDEIVYLESQKEYIQVHTTSTVITSRQSMQESLRRLPAHFLRLHRSFAVNIDKVTAYTSAQVVAGDTELPIGEMYRQEVNRALESAFNR